MSRTGRATAATLIGFLVLISAFLGPRIYVDHTLLVGDTLLRGDPSFRDARDDLGSRRPGNRLMDVDNTLQLYPFRHYAQAAFRDGEIPWWNPYVGLGLPFVALGSGVFDPVAVAASLLASPAALTNVLAVAGLGIGGVGMFVLLGALGLARWTRVFGAVAFMFSGWTVAWLGRGNFIAESWMPWLFWAAELLLRRPTVGRIGGLALFAALVSLPGHLATTFHILAALGTYAAVRAGAAGDRPLRVRARVVSALVLAVVLGSAVNLVQLVPMVDLVAQSDLPAEGRGKQLPARGVVDLLHHGAVGNGDLLGREGPTILTALSPLFFGSPRGMVLADPSGSAYWWPWANFPETIMYVGLAPLFFALYALARRRQIPGIGAWLILAGVSAAVAYALPLFNIVNYLPGFNQINNGRLRLVFRFAVVVAAALGLERFTAATGRCRDRSGVRPIGAYAMVALTLPVVAHLAVMPMVVDLEPARVVAFAWKAQVPALVILGSLVAAAALRARCVLGPAAFAVIVVAITTADLFWFLRDYNPSLPSIHVFPRTATVRALEADRSLFRVWSDTTAGILLPNVKLPYRIFDVDAGSVLTLGRYVTLQDTVKPPARRHDPAANPSLKLFALDLVRHRGLVSLMNVKYVVTAIDGVRAPPYYRLVHERDVRIYENREVLPRAFLVDVAIVLDSPSAVLEVVTRPDFVPAAVVLLEDRASPPVASPADGGGPAGTAEVLQLTSNRVVVRAETRRSAYLVLSEAYHPGWRATVNGAPAAIYRANYLFRAVHLGPGVHEVVFTFMPRSYAVAAWSSLAAAAIIAACLVWGSGWTRGGSQGSSS